MTVVVLDGVRFDSEGDADFSLAELAGWESGVPFRGDLRERSGADGLFGLVRDFRTGRTIGMRGLVRGGDLRAAKLLQRRLAAIQASGAPVLLEVTDVLGTLTSEVLVRFVEIDDSIAEGSTSAFVIQMVAPDPVKYGPSRTFSTGLPRPGGGLEYELFNGPPIPLPANYVYVQGAAPDRENVFWLNPDAASVPLAYNGDPETMPTPADVLVASTIPEGYAGQFVYDPLTYELKENPTYGT